MNLLNKTANKLKYSMPELEIIKAGDDIITKSISVAKSNPEELVEEPDKKEQKRVELGTGNVVDIYPDGLPLNVMEVIDYKKFGQMLKQEQLLPPSYDKRPNEVKIDADLGIPILRLTFKSKTSNSYRVIGISRYYVSCAKNGDTVHKIDPLMIAVWRRFVEYVMWKWEQGYRFELFDKERKGEIGKTLMQEDAEYIEHIKRMAEEYLKVIEEQHKDL